MTNDANETSAYAKQLPLIHPENEPYWASLRAHELRMQRCSDCGTLRYPISPVCYSCFSDHAEWDLLSGRGTLGSWIIIERATGNPVWSEDVPYIVAQVELEEGTRLTTNIVEAGASALRVGMPVEIVFDDVTPEVTLAKFRPTS